MKNGRTTLFPLFAGITLLAGVTPLSAQKPDIPTGFTALFDGKSLKGWKGDPVAWSVVDGTIVSRPNPKIYANTYLIHQRTFADFELRFKYRWKTMKGNSGVQIRSHEIDGHYVMTGMQVNVTNSEIRPERFGMLYNETGDRQEMALLGQRAEISRRSANGAGTGRVVRTVKEMVNRREDIIGAVRNGPEWTEVVVIAYGDRIVSAINGMLAFDALDKDPVGKREGLIGLQNHRSSPNSSEFEETFVEFKDIAIKPLSRMPDLSARFKSHIGPAPEPRVTYKDSTRAGLADVALPTE